ncbi:hypothetical protein BDM02DRAFT_3103599, partial [Thelephora ganbajun]
MEAFTLGNRLVMSIPDDLCCDKNNSTWGNTWAKPQFTTPQTLPLIFEMEQYKTWSLSTVDPSTGHIQWDIAQCHAFMGKIKEIIRLLGFLNYFIPGPPARGTELILDRIYNTQVKRNYYMDFGWMLVARRYSKTSSITGRDSLTAAFMPKQLAEVNQYYQLFFRPLEQLIAAQIYPAEQASLYHEFMYLLGGNRWTPDQFRAYIPQMSTKYFGSNLKVSYLCHMLIAIKRAFIPPMLTDIFQDIGDRMSAHSTQIANAWYAVEDALEGKTTTFMSDTRDWCRQYHNVLGVGELQDIPIPIRFLARPPATPATSIGSIFLPTNDEVAKLQQTIIHLFTSIAQDLKLHLTQEMQGAIYASISQATTSLHIPNPLSSSSSLPSVHLPPHQLPQSDIVDLTTYAPPISRPPRLVQQQPRTVFGDMSFLPPDPPTPDLSTISEQELGKLTQEALQYYYPSTAGFKSKGQQNLLWACLRREFTLAILPTGGGKSIAYELPPLITTMITVAIIPFKRILCQAYERACASGVLTVEWVSGTNPLEAKDANLLLVSIEAAMAPKFKDFLTRYRHRISHIVLEEAHTVLVHANFREALSKVALLGEHPLP